MTKVLIKNWMSMDEEFWSWSETIKVNMNIILQENSPLEVTEEVWNILKVRAEKWWVAGHEIAIHKDMVKEILGVTVSKLKKEKVIVKKEENSQEIDPIEKIVNEIRKYKDRLEKVSVDWILDEDLSELLYEKIKDILIINFR